MLDKAIPATETAGIVVALRRDGEPRIEPVAGTVEAVIDQESEA